ncbi:MAG: PEGA domain-containing protein [Myxococcales bacterium]|nr:PEGA domain-containing protein [Myxococcales bacterium]
MRATRSRCRAIALCWGLTLLACATKDDASVSESASPSAATESTTDAGAVLEPAPAAITVAPPTGTHLDGDTASYRPRDYQLRKNKSKTIELVLRSSPPGATASIDGKAIGVTPTFWSGTADQRAHDFTFVKGGYTMARYRFVATHSGTVHGSLSPLQIREEAETTQAATP